MQKPWLGIPILRANKETATTKHQTLIYISMIALCYKYQNKPWSRDKLCKRTQALTETWLIFEIYKWNTGYHKNEKHTICHRNLSLKSLWKSLKKFSSIRESRHIQPVWYSQVSDVTRKMSQSHVCEYRLRSQIWDWSSISYKKFRIETKMLYFILKTFLESQPLANMF